MLNHPGNWQTHVELTRLRNEELDRIVQRRIPAHIPVGKWLRAVRFIVPHRRRRHAPVTTAHSAPAPVRGSLGR